MKDDYLWDKTGEDAEIQGLENALKAFRFQENAPPALPQKVFTLEKQTPRRFFRFGFAFTAFAAAFVVFSLLWLQIGNDKIPAIESVAENNPAKRAEKIAGETFIESPAAAAAPLVKPENPRPAAQPNVIKIRQNSAPAIVRTRKAVWRKPKIKEPLETLTAEEKYAVDQLMLALSITGSKLKIVKDKVQGIEEQTAVIETAK